MIARHAPASICNDMNVICRFLVTVFLVSVAVAQSGQGAVAADELAALTYQAAGD